MVWRCDRGTPMPSTQPRQQNFGERMRQDFTNRPHQLVQMDGHDHPDACPIVVESFSQARACAHQSGLGNHRRSNAAGYRGFALRNRICRLERHWLGSNSSKDFRANDSAGPLYLLAALTIPHSAVCLAFRDLVPVQLSAIED